MTALRTRGKGGGVPARSRDYYLDAGQEYVRRYGADELTQAAFNPGTAKRAGRPDLLQRYYSPRENGDPWPSLNAIKSAFGKWNDFREALHLPPNTTGPSRGRRANGEAEPIVNVREVRQIVPDSTLAYLRQQVAKAERRANQLAVELDREKGKVHVVEDTAKLEDLRKRLADESARRRDATRGFNNAVRREERARARETALRAAVRGDAALLAEVDRLTALLADTQTRLRMLETGSPLPPKIETKVEVRTVYQPDTKTLNRIERQEAALERARDERDRAEERCLDLAERLADIRADAITRAIATQRVRDAERRAEEAQREAREMASLLVGEARSLTDNEIATLRRDGPAGKILLVLALRKLIHARYEGGRDAQVSALTDIAAAAYNWRDRLLS